MRYTKDLQSMVCNDIQNGVTPQECSLKYNVPVNVIIKWNNLEIPNQRANEIALRKYQAEVSEAEASITDELGEYFDADISDDDYFNACDKISKKLYKLVSDVVVKERKLNPHEERPSDAQIIIDITNRWKDNRFIK